MEEHKVTTLSTTPQTLSHSSNQPHSETAPPRTNSKSPSQIELTEPDDPSTDHHSPPPLTTKPKFPTSLSDLYHPPPELAPPSNIYKTLHRLHHSTLSPLPRLRSIHADSLFIARLHAHTSLPLIANERCGSWYTPPDLKAGSAYFKSTDGHVGQWAFSLRRLNLDLLGVLGREGGAVLVDSTRRGKSVSDALRRTVVGWVVVVNRVLFGEKEGARGVVKGELFKVQTLQGEEGLTGSERANIEARVTGWCVDFLSLGLDVEELRRRLKQPIRCVWAVNGEWDSEEPFRKNDYENSGENVLVLASASRRVRGAEMSEGGYIQGAADDTENWSRGLTAALWWENCEQLLAAGEHEIEGVIDEIVAGDRSSSMSAGEVRIAKAGNLFIGSGIRQDAGDHDLVINCQGKPTLESKKVLGLACRDAKIGSKDLREKLVVVEQRVKDCLSKKPDSRVLVTCDTGKDLSAGVVLALLCLFYDNDGQLTLGNSSPAVDKLMIKKRLIWITDCKSDVNPSRATMQAVNTFVIGRPS